MIIIGIGSNLGNRQQNCRAAINHLKTKANISINQVSAVYQSAAQMPKNAPEHWAKPFYNAAIAIDTSLNPQQLLKALKKTEEMLGRQKNGRWAPRLIDLDILCWHDQQIVDAELIIPHKELLERPFALWPLLDLAPDWQHPNYNRQLTQLKNWGSRFLAKAAFGCRQTNIRLDAPQLVGIVNLSPQSFSADAYTQPEDAIAHAIKLWQQGASVIDIGGLSTKPQAKALAAKEVWLRIKPVINGLKQYWQDNPEQPLLSIDTHQVEVAERCIELGVDWINDVSGLKNPKMQKLAQKSDCNWVIMHHLTIPADPKQHIALEQNPVTTLMQWFKQQITTLDIDIERLMLDPGIGFGKTAAQSRQILQNIAQFNDLGCKILVGHSRKSVGRHIKPLGNTSKDIEMLAVSLALADKPVDYLRVHNIDWLQQALISFLSLRK